MAQGFILWFTGLSGSGKSTLASLVSERLRGEGVHVECLDGDEVRKHLSWGLGFSREDRDRNVRRIGYVARMVARSGACAITAAISPYQSIRDEIRSQTERFCEVYCECPLETLAERDPKGLYRRAMAGEIKNFTGVDDPYEAPPEPDVHLHTDRQSVEECVELILERLSELGFVSGTESDARPALAAPYGGELFEAPTREPDHDGVHSSVLEITRAEVAVVALLAAGWLSPLIGFMTEREAEKVDKQGMLERGLPFPVPLVLPARSECLTETGQLVGLTCEGRQVARMQVQQLWTQAGQGFVAGVIESVAPGPMPMESARELRRRLLALRVTGAVACLAKGPPDELAMLRLQGAIDAAGTVIVLAPRDVSDAYCKRLEGCSGVLVCTLPAELEGDVAAGLLAVIATNLGAVSSFTL